jgi:hypothetical protein
MSHQGAARPDVKNSAVLLPALRAIQSAGMNDPMIEAATIAQSNEVKRMNAYHNLTAGRGSGGHER